MVTSPLFDIKMTVDIARFTYGRYIAIGIEKTQNLKCADLVTSACALILTRLYPTIWLFKHGLSHEQIRSGITIGNSKVTLKALSLFVELQLKVVKGSKFTI